MKRVPLRHRLSDKQRLCLIMIGNHQRVGTYTEFSKPQTRRTVHSLYKKKLVQWLDSRWVLTKDGYREWLWLVVEESTKATA